MTSIRKPRPVRTLLAAVSCAVLTAGCTTLPSNTEPQALRSFDVPTESATNRGPEPGREPDLLLRDFYTSSAQPTQDYFAARSYLMPETAEQWNPQESLLVVDRIDLNTQPGSTSDKRTFSVRGAVIGRIAAGGSYEPENGVYEATIEMARNTSGEWRISSLPAGIVLERTEMRNQFQPQLVYFFEPTNQALVMDRRWIYSGHESLDAVLISLIMEGPSRLLAPAVNNDLPAEATFAGINDGIYQFTGFTGMDADARLRFAAQLVWTLASANVPEPYSVQVDGAPIVPGYGELTTDDFAKFNPQVTNVANTPLFALTDGVVHRVSATAVTPVEGDLGTMGGVTSVDIITEGAAAAVRKVGNESELYVGDLDGNLEPVLKAETISRPTFELDPSALWAVIDGRTVERVVISGVVGGVSRTEVDISALDAMGGDISVLRLSRTGARVAMIVDGRVYAGVVSRPGPGQRRVVNVHELAPQLGATALSLDWQPDGSLIVGTSTPETPIWRVEQDGSAATSLPSGNITAPVVAVAASSTTIYLTDALAVRQMPTTGGDNAFWREVAGLQGVRSAAVIAN